MAVVRIAKKKVWVDEVGIPLLSGEVHYWRFDAANWQPALRRAREMGLQVIATYVCWDFHEVEPGHYDFRGETDPRRNLLGFLDLLTAEGLWIILRPGPYIYSEWRNNGVPDDAVHLHRLDPILQERAQPYMQAVTEFAQPYLATHGGRIILWQAENEIDPWPPWYTEQLGLGQKAGPFRDQEFYLLAVNYGIEDKFAEVALNGNFEQSPCWQARDLLSGQQWTVNLRESSQLSFPLPRKDGVILHLKEM